MKMPVARDYWPFLDALAPEDVLEMPTGAPVGVMLIAVVALVVIAAAIVIVLMARKKE